jgi:hypothetical protein
MAWSVVEAILNLKWKQLLKNADVKNEGHTSFNKDRRKLLEGRDYTASIISQMLSITGNLNDELLQKADHARKQRNDFAHKLECVDPDDVVKVVQLGTALLSEMTGITISQQLSLSYWI